MTDAFSSVIYGTEFDLKSSIWNGVKSGVTSMVFAGIINAKYAVKGITFGRGSWSAISDQIFTKFRRNLIKYISWKTVGKMFGLSL